MRTKIILAGAALAAALVSSSAQATTTVTIPDPGPSGFIFFGSGDASVTYDGVTFSQSSSLSNGNFFNVGPSFSGDPPVISSQEQTIGEANILITFPTSTTSFSLNYGTFGGSDVTFLLSNNDSATRTSTTGGDYAAPDFFTDTDSAFTSVLVTSDDGVLNVNNIEYNLSATPLPPTWTMLIAGFAGLGFFAFRGAKKSPAGVAVA